MPARQAERFILAGMTGRMGLKCLLALSYSLKGKISGGGGTKPARMKRSDGPAGFEAILAKELTGQYWFGVYYFGKRKV